MVGFRGLEIKPSDPVSIALAGGLGGVILFDRDQITGGRRNISSPDQLKSLTASLRAAGPAGALGGVVLLLAGLVAGYLAAGAVQLRALAGATTVPAAHAALATAAGHWTLTAAGLAGAVALALTCIGGRRKGVGPEAGPKSGPKAAPAAGPGAGPGNVTGAPVPGAGAMPDHG